MFEIGIVSLKRLALSLVFYYQHLRYQKEYKKIPLGLAYSKEDFISQALALVSVGLTYLFFTTNAATADLPPYAHLLITAGTALIVGWKWYSPFCLFAANLLALAGGVNYLKSINSADSASTVLVLFIILAAAVTCCIGSRRIHKKFHRTSFLYQILGSALLLLHLMFFSSISTTPFVDTLMKHGLTQASLISKLIILGLLLTCGAQLYLLKKQNRQAFKTFLPFVFFISIATLFLTIVIPPLSSTNTILTIPGLIWILCMNAFCTAALLLYTLEGEKRELASVVFLLFILSRYFFTTPLYAWRLGIFSLTSTTTQFVEAALGRGLKEYFSEAFNLPFALWVTGLLFLSVLCYILTTLYSKNKYTKMKKAFSSIAFGTFLFSLFFLSLYRGMAHIDNTTDFSFLANWLKITSLLAPLYAAIITTAFFAWHKKLFKKESIYCIGTPLAVLAACLIARLHPLLNGTTLTFWGALWSACFSAFLCAGLVVMLQHQPKKSSFLGLMPIIVPLGLALMLFSWTYSWNIFLFSSNDVPLIFSLFAFLAALFFIGRLFVNKKIFGTALQAYELFCAVAIMVISILLLANPAYVLLLQITTTTAWSQLSPLISIVTIAAFFAWYNHSKGTSLKPRFYQTCRYGLFLGLAVIGAVIFTIVVPQSFHDTPFELSLIGSITKTALAFLTLHIAFSFGKEIKYLSVSCVVALCTIITTFLATQKIGLPYHLIVILALICIYLLGNLFTSLKRPRISAALQGLSFGILILLIYTTSTLNGLLFFAEQIKTPLLAFPPLQLLSLLPFLSIGAYCIMQINKTAQLKKDEIIGIGLLLAATAATLFQKAPVLFDGTVLTSTGFVWAIVFNVLSFISLLSLILLGYRYRSIWLINTGTALLFLLIIIKYFDWFFSYLNKTVFFMISGLILLAVGYAMEKGRIYLLQKITKRIRRKK